MVNKPISNSGLEPISIDDADFGYPIQVIPRASELGWIEWNKNIESQQNTTQFSKRFKKNAIYEMSVKNNVKHRQYPDSMVHGANMGPTWVLSAPDRPNVGPMILAIRVRINNLFNVTFGVQSFHLHESTYFLVFFLYQWFRVHFYQAILYHMAQEIPTNLKAHSYQLPAHPPYRSWYVYHMSAVDPAPPGRTAASCGTQWPPYSWSRQRTRARSHSSLVYPSHDYTAGTSTASAATWSHLGCCWPSLGKQNLYWTEACIN